jgi:hypothetical protein
MAIKGYSGYECGEVAIITSNETEKKYSENGDDKKIYDMWGEK